MEKFSYTKNWFDSSEIKKNIFKYFNNNQINNILEIGCFEGKSAVFFSNYFLEKDNSSLTLVDPFYISGTVKGITSQFIDEKTKERFLNNINQTKNKNKITFHNTESDLFFKNNNKYFNFIYIDGCHEPEYIKRDIENAFKFIEKNGIIWMDDYLGGKNYNIKNAIDATLENFKNKFTVIHKGYQLAIRINNI